MALDPTSAKPKYNREATLRTLAAQMQRESAILEREIQAEEERTGRHDPSDIAYPMTARAMRERRQKISYTLATLQIEMAPSSNAA